MLRPIFFLLTSLQLLLGQECQLTALNAIQPPLKLEEGERATESQTFQTAIFAISPADTIYFVDALNRIRRMDGDGRLRTVAGNGTRADQLTGGDALSTPLPPIGQLAFPSNGELHFASVGRVFRVSGGKIEPVAGSGRPGFNGESGAALDLNLGTIVHIAFGRAGELLILDGFNRLRKMESGGILRTIAGSTRVAATTGLTGDNGPATQAALSSPRQVVPLIDGSLWIKDLSGRHLRLLTNVGEIRTINTNFEATINIMQLADGSPAAATANRVYPIRSNGAIEIGSAPYPSFTGTPRGIGPNGALYFEGSARPEQRNPLVRLSGGTQTVIAGAPVAALVDGQAAPFGAWDEREKRLLFASSLGGKAGIFEARAGQSPRFVVGGGNEIGDADSKAATAISIFGVQAFTVDGEGRIIVADVYRRRILVVGTDGKLSVLKTQDGKEIPYQALGVFANLQRIVADKAGNIYWYSEGATPIGGVFTADISVWQRSNSSLGIITIVGLAAMGRLGDGTAAVIAGNGVAFRSVYRLSPAGKGEELTGLRWLPLQSVATVESTPYFVAASRLFRGVPGQIEMLDLALLPGGANFIPDFVVSSGEQVMIHLTNGGFYRIEDPSGCAWLRQPAISVGGIVNAASFEYSDMISPRQLTTLFGTGLGPAEGQGLIFDGSMRAVGQPAPYPALMLGNFFGTIPLAALTGTPLPVVYSNDRQVTVMGVTTVPASGEYLLYFSWQGLQLIHSKTVRVVSATPGLFASNGQAVALNEDGSRNSLANAAALGSAVQLFATGLGAIDTALTLGDFFSSTVLANTMDTVSVWIDGKEAEVAFAGGAPGQIGGLYQINVQVPEGIEPGLREIVVKVDGQQIEAGQRAKIAIR